jgi:antitoxin YefM
MRLRRIFLPPPTLKSGVHRAKSRWTQYNLVTGKKADIHIRKNIKRYFDQISQNFETLIINRDKDSGIVIMSLAEYNSLKATHHELSSKANEERLDSAIQKLKSGKSFEKQLLEE